MRGRGRHEGRDRLTVAETQDGGGEMKSEVERNTEGE